MSRARSVAALGAVAAIAAPAAASLAATSHAKLWQNKAKTVVCGIKRPRSSKLVICSSKDVPKAKKGVGDPFVQLGKTGKPKLVLESQSPFQGSNPATLGKGSTWSSFGVTCTVASKTVTCKNKSKHGFTIGSGKYKSF
jgi:hypothetical protein